MKNKLHIRFRRKGNKMMGSGVTDVPVTKLANDAFSISTYVKGLAALLDIAIHP